jgi:hypothetical protein
VSPTNITTTIAPAVDDYVTTVDTKDDFTVTTDSGTAKLRLASYVAGGRARFNMSSSIPTLVTTFALGAYPVGRAVEVRRDGLTVACIRANSSGVVTYIYTGGFSEHEFDVNGVDPYVYLNDTANFSVTRESYDASAYTAQVTITHIGDASDCGFVVHKMVIQRNECHVGHKSRRRLRMGGNQLHDLRDNSCADFPNRIYKPGKPTARGRQWRGDDCRNHISL